MNEDTKAGIERELGRPLTVHEGSLTITEAGALVEGLDVRGDLIIDAPRVVIAYCAIAGEVESAPRAQGVLHVCNSYLGYDRPPGKANIDMQKWPALLLQGMQLRPADDWRCEATS